MTTEQAKQIFQTAIDKETDAARIAKLELLREFFTNEAFRKNLADYTYANQN